LWGDYLGKIIDLTGQRFGRLTVVEFAGLTKVGKSVTKKAAWNCKCDCGVYKIVLRHSLVNGNTTSCGCARKGYTKNINRKDLKGMRFGKLTVLELVSANNKDNNLGRIAWKCKCDCGNICYRAPGEFKYKSPISCGKCPTCAYKLSICKTYYEGYILKKYSKINQTFNDFDLDIFGLDIVNVGISFEDTKQLAFQYEPDFIFDKQFYDEITKHNWYKCEGGIYTSVNSIFTSLQRFIMSQIKTVHLDCYEVTFVNKSKKSDYRLSNIIFTDNRNIIRNTSLHKNPSIYRGVRIGKSGKFYSNINFKKKNYHLGTFATQEEAAEAYNKKSRELFGKFAYQNKIKKSKKAN
jgi:hypothetical protein